MVEQTQRRVSENDLVLVRGLDTLFIHHTPARRSEVPHPAPSRPMHVIREREERIAAARDTIKLPRMLLALLRAQRRRHLLEERLPLRALRALERLARDEEVDRVRLLGALDALLEREREHARVVAEPPEVGLGACEARAVDAGLLASADANDSAAVGVRDAVRLGVLQRERGDDEVRQRLLRELGRRKSQRVYA